MRRDERGCRGRGHPDHQRALVGRLQPRAPARAVGGWYRGLHPTIRVEKRQFLRMYTQQNAGSQTRKGKPLQCLGEGEYRRDNRPRWTHVPTKVPGEGTNTCTQSSFATKNVFDALQGLRFEVRFCGY